MSDRYVENIPSDMAKLIVGEAYNSELQYTLVTERDFSCISAYNPKTGESVAVSVDGDDLNLDIEDFQRDIKLEESFNEEVNEFESVNKHIGSKLLTVWMVLSIIIILVIAIVVLKEVRYGV